MQEGTLGREWTFTGVSIDEVDDRELWQRAAAGDGDGFAALYERYADGIYGYCFRRTASWSTAQDLTSVVFLEAWRRRRVVQLDEQGSVAAWLFGVAGNVVRNSTRSQLRYQRVLSALPPVAAQPDFTEDLAGRVDDEKQMRRVLDAIDLLPELDREVLALCAWTSLSRAEVATCLSIAEGTVKSRLSRARQRLRALSEHDLPDVPDVPDVSEPPPRRARHFSSEARSATQEAL